LNHLYPIALDAAFVSSLTIFGENNAMAEGSFTGLRIGEFNGIPAAGMDVNVPMCPAFNIENERLSAAASTSKCLLCSKNSGC